MEDNIVLKMQNISKSFPGVKALQRVNLEVKQGEVHALLGENGAGKSTLLKILAGAYVKDEGEIYINGKLIEHMDPKIAENLGISIIYQEFSCLPYLSVAENIFLGRQRVKSNGMIDWNKCYEDSKKLLDRVGLKVDPKTLLKDLKVAEQQMVEIAKALSKSARIIVMDEPTASLTQREIDCLFQVIRDLKSQGVSIIYVSHRLVEIKEICDHITVLRDGSYIGNADVAAVTIQDMIRMMVGRNLTDMYPKSDAVIKDKILEVKNLSTVKIKNISFYVRKGEILGIAGLVGAGRTELARAIFGADPILEGAIIINSKTVKIKNPSDAISYNMGLVPEDRKRQGLILGMNVKENTTLASLKKFVKFGKLKLAEEEKISQNFVDKLRIVTPGIFEKANNLSGGNQQKVVLSKWLCSNCDILIIDEPTRGIDVGAKVEIYELMNELVRGGLGIIMISSEMPELIGVCDRILVMHEGTVTGELMRGDFSEEKIMAYAAGQHPEIEEVYDGRE